MDLKLDNLFEVIYPSFYNKQQVEKLKNDISLLKIDNILNLNKKKRDKFFIVVSETKEEIDFRISPFFELLDPVKKVSEIEEYDFMVINEGLQNNDYESFSTNININLIDTNCNNSLTKISIKKMIQELKYPEEIIDTLEDENELLNSFYSNNFNEDQDEDEDEDEQNNNDSPSAEVTNILNEVNSENTISNDEENELNDKYLRKVKLIRSSYLCGFDFQITENENSELMISDILEKGIADKKLYYGDKIISINNLDVKAMSFKSIIKYLCSNLEIELLVYNDNIFNKKDQGSITNFYRINGGKYLKLQIFKKKYDEKSKKYNKKNIKFITTIILSNDFSYPKILSHDTQSLTKDNQQLFFNLEYFENYYCNFNEMPSFYEFMNSLELNNILSNDFFETLDKIRSGYYFNTKSIIWNIYLATLLCSNVEDEKINSINYKHFKKRNIRQLYFPNYKKKDASCFENNFVKSIKMVCDVCQSVVSENLTTKFYGSSIYGDLCEKCYNEKKQMFNNRINYLKKLILMEGRKVVFSKNLEKTKLFLNNYNIKELENNKKFEIMKCVNNTLIVKEHSKICKICFEPLEDNLCASINCGHCFHYECIKSVGSFNCPACRVNTRYVKLFF